MHRVDRVARHMLVDTSAIDIDTPITTLDFPGVLGTNPAEMFVQTDMALVKDTHAVAWYKGSGQTWAIAPGDTFAFGRFINGWEDLDAPFHLNVSGAMKIHGIGAGIEMDVGMYIGELDSGSVVKDYTAQVNQVSNAVRLPLVQQFMLPSAEVMTCSVDVSLLNGLFNGSEAAYSSQPIGVFWCVTNYGAGSTRNIDFMRASLSAFKWSSDIDSLDPVR